MSANKTARLVIVKNPFQAWNGRVVKEIPAGTKLRKELVGNADIGCEIYTSVNGRTVAIDDYEVLGGEIITVSPIVAKGGKSILGIIAMVALTVVSMGVGNLAAGGSFFTLAAGEAWGATSFALAALTTMVGGTLINKAFTQMPKAPSLTNDNSEATYGWGGVQTLEGQNNAIPMTYGTVKSGGQSIAKYVEVKDNKEYLNWLIACGEGELTFSNIMINDNPYTYYDGVNVQTRAGTNNQEIIPYFNDTYFTKTLGYEVQDTSYRLEQAQGTGTQGLIIKIEFSQGLYYAKDDGSLGEAWVKISADYRKSNGAWTPILSAEKITGKQSSALRKEYRIDNLEAGEYEVRVTVIERSHKTTNSRAGVKCYWTALTSIVYDDFSYPNTALIGVRALATDQLNGSPTISFLKTRSKVWVYNSRTKRYEQKNANNPAWACYDMLHLASYINGIYDVRGVPAHSIIYEQFEEWGSFCEVSNYHVNIEIASNGEMLNVINENIACIGHGMVVRFGTRYGCIWYCKKQPVQMFGMGNIISGTFKEDFLETTSRANAIEITYIDADHDYNKETITIYGDNYDTDAKENATQVTYNGITSYEQAFREGKYQLACNKYQLRTVTFEANIDAIACTIGDVVLVSHDVPQWKQSGRIYSVDVAKGEFVLPIELESTNGSIRMMYRTINDNLYTIDVSVVKNENGWCTVRGTIPNSADAPQKNDIFDIGLTNVGSKPFIVTNITRAQDFTRNITGIEYIESVYNEDYTIPPIEYSQAKPKTASTPTNLSAIQIKSDNGDGTFTYLLDCSWDCENYEYFSVYASYDGEKYFELASTVKDKNFSFPYSSEFYSFRVIAHNGLSVSKQATTLVRVMDLLQLPSVVDLQAEHKYRELMDGTIQYDLIVTWQPPNYAGYRQGQVWYKVNSVQTNALTSIAENLTVDDFSVYGDWHYAGTGYDTFIIPNAIVGEKYYIVVCTEDRAGYFQDKESNDVPSVVHVIDPATEIPNTPNNLKVSITDTFNIDWEHVRNIGIKYYEVRTDCNVHQENNGLIARVTETEYSTNAIQNREGEIFIFAISDYNIASAPAKMTYNFPAPKAPSLEVNSRTSGIECNAGSIPSNCIGVHWLINGTNDTYYDFKTTDSTYYFTANSGQFDITARFYDYFGDGDYSKKSVLIKPYISDELIQSESISLDKLTSTTQDAIKNGGVNAVNIAVRGMLGEGSALTLQPDGSYALVASNGEKLTGMFANQDGVMRLQGEYIHVTGDTVFDANAMIKGVLTSGAVAIDGSDVVLDRNGLSFYDDNGVSYGSIGRMVFGKAKHNQTITFAHEWDNLPMIYVMPQEFTSTYMGVLEIMSAIKTVCSYTNQTKRGFKVQCYSTALASSVENISGIRLLLKSFAPGGKTDNTWYDYETGNIKFVNVPSGKTNFVAIIETLILPRAFGYDFMLNGKEQSRFLTRGMVKVKIDMYSGNTVVATTGYQTYGSIETVPDDTEADQERGTSLSQITLTGNCTAGQTISFKVYYSFLVVKDGHEAIFESYYGTGGHHTSYTPKVQLDLLNVKFLSTPAETVIATGDCNFIAVERQNETYTIS